MQRHRQRRRPTQLHIDQKCRRHQQTIRQIVHAAAHQNHPTALPRMVVIKAVVVIMAIVLVVVVVAKQRQSLQQKEAQNPQQQIREQIRRLMPQRHQTFLCLR